MSDAPVEIKVASSGSGYSVWVGPGLMERADELIPVPERAEVIAVVSDANVQALHGERISLGLEAIGRRAVPFATEPGEGSKTIDNVEALLRGFVGNGLHRGDLVVGVGGGVTTDVAGFVAAVYHRGLSVAHVPTTLLGQVDAAIGGKTGVNLPEGKNLVGAFHQPVAVLADITALATLPEEELRSGLAEVVKHAMLADPPLLQELVDRREAIFDRDPEVLTDVVARAAVVKCRIVERDETERGERMHLNYGHTVGHALEALGGYERWRHGEAVALGMTFAAALAAELGMENWMGEHRRVLEALGLPTRGAGDVPLQALLEVMAGDKKYDAGMRFVVLEAPGRPKIVTDVPRKMIAAAYEWIK
ncbi:MAG: 3-dehydroquinate synthase [Actinomycetota bacterium]